MNDTIGCTHYRRKCLFLAPCCKKMYTCRICHDEEQDHQLNRKSVKMVKCALCLALQPISERCRSCNIFFADYRCMKCNLFDSLPKGQFHCEECGICRVGGRDNFFHCKKCGLCLNKNLQDNHKCIENASHTSCPICIVDLHSSMDQLEVPVCGHLIHKKCYEELIKKGITNCTLCAATLKPALNNERFLF